jgi:hypothetical protein
VKPTVFIAMPFAAIFRPGLDRVILPAIEKAGAEAVRADQEKQGHIHTQMFDRIIDSRALVIDLSGLNPNVFYEMGVAHALHRRSIMVVNQAHLQNVPFDIAPYRVLVYPDPAKAKPKELAAAIDKLAEEIRDVLAHPEIGIPNPVMDFLLSRSPVGAAQTLYLPALKEEHEREIIHGAAHHLTYFGLTGLEFALKMIDGMESGTRSPRLELRLRLLDPGFVPAWRFMDELQNGSESSEEEIKDFILQESATQRRAVQKLEKVASRFPDFKLDVRYYQTVPLFWAYGWDDKKWAVGHYAMRRIQARGLPVTVISAADPQTSALFSHYAQIVLGLPLAAQA